MILRTAVIGVGFLGEHHARILKKHINSELKFVVDISEKRAYKIAKINSTKYSIDYKNIVNDVDAVVISVPTKYHYEIAKFFLLNGVHCLVEKPFTITVADADELINISFRKKLILQVGHIERFNPAVIAVEKLINKPRFVEVNRLSQYNDRSKDVGVVLDLMIHDLDILYFLIKEDVVSFEAYGAKIFSNVEDIAKVRLKYLNGCVADISASRISIKKYRKIRIFQLNNYISIDYSIKKIEIYTKKIKNITSFSDIDIKEHILKSNEPLFYELDNFLNNIIYNKKPIVSGEHGRNAVKLANNILKNMIF
jgi:predicted dehydrogenase